MKVSEIMIKDVYTVTPDTPIKKVASMLCMNRITGIPVVNNENEVVGIVSEKDILHAMYPGHDEFYREPLSNMDFEEMEKRYKDVTLMKTEDLMVREVITVTADTPILRAVSLMLLKRIRRIPIIEGKKLVGTITQGCIHRAIFKRELGI